MAPTSRTIVQKENPVLRGHARNISLDEIKSDHIHDLISDMKALLAKEKYGVALAAPQVGEPIRLFVVASKALIQRKRAANKPKHEEDLDEEYLEGVQKTEGEVYINPELLKVSRARKDKHEGCLSVRGKWGVVSRAEKVSVRAYDENGKPFTRGASGFLAHIFQHELDHLDGILYIDKAVELYDDEPEKD